MTATSCETKHTRYRITVRTHWRTKTRNGTASAPGSARSDVLGIQIKSIATPRRRGARTFGVVVMMLPMLGRGCWRSAACSCPGRRVLRPSGFRTRALLRGCKKILEYWTGAPINDTFCFVFVPFQRPIVQETVHCLVPYLHVWRGGGGSVSQDAARR